MQFLTQASCEACKIGAPLLTEWDSVEVSWWSHKIKGLHKNDFIMAAKTDALFNT